MALLQREASFIFKSVARESSKVACWAPLSEHISCCEICFSVFVCSLLYWLIFVLVFSPLHSAYFVQCFFAFWLVSFRKDDEPNSFTDVLLILRYQNNANAIAVVDFSLEDTHSLNMITSYVIISLLFLLIKKTMRCCFIALSYTIPAAWTKGVRTT